MESKLLFDRLLLLQSNICYNVSRINIDNAYGQCSLGTKVHCLLEGPVKKKWSGQKKIVEVKCII